jgi:hypothetical protein
MRTPAFSPIRRGVLEKMFGYDRANQLICERDFLLKRRAYRKRKT